MLPESHTVDAAVAEGRLLFLLGEVCRVCSHLPMGVSRVERQRLSLQKSAPLIVPKKWLITTEGRVDDKKLCEIEGEGLRLKTVAPRRLND